MNAAEVVSLLLRYHQASTGRLHLIPSENRLSAAARLPFVTDAVHRYSFPAQGGSNWAWPGNDDLAAIEEAAADGLRELFGAQYANIKPVSGITCMAAALSAAAEPGATVFHIAEADGGHGSTPFLARRLGLVPVPLPYDRSLYQVDHGRLADLASVTRGPKLVYLDQFMCLFPHDLTTLRAAVGPDTVIHYDGSHVMGLIAGGQFQDPLKEGADSLGGSTHKTFPGPHKGVLLTNSPRLAAAIDEHAAHWVSHHHPADVAALAIAVFELAADAPRYAARTVANARHLGNALAAQGVPVCADRLGYTRSHQLWLDVSPVLDPFEASRRLLAAGIVVNAIDIPYLRSRTGLRLGVQEATRLGMTAEAMERIADILARLIVDKISPRKVAPDVQELLADYAAPDAGLIDTAVQVLAATVTPEKP